MSASPLDAASPVDRRFMQRALRAALRGRPSPNPHVGALVVANGEVVGVGHHEKAGADHAEVAALKKAGERARGATVYVTMDPCNHFGRTPPCTDALIAAGVARVVIGCADPKPHVPGAREKLGAAGIEVVVGVEQHAAELVVRDFARHIETGLPCVRLKAAVTLDGHVAARDGSSRWITGEAAREEAHRMRDASDAVLVGVGTVLADDPELTVRHVRGKDPLRVVLDTELRMPETARLLHVKSRARTLVLHAEDASPEKRDALAKLRNVELAAVPRAAMHLDVGAAMRELGKRDVVRLLVEGGPRVHGALLDAGLVQRVSVFVAPALLADPAALPLARGAARTLAEAVRLGDVAIERLGDDVLIDGWVASRGEVRTGS